jgi:hypothetical protein
MEWAFSDSADSSLSLLAPSPNIRGASFPPATEQDFELYVYAALQCGGWFVEPNPKEHDLDNIELFEIDAVARKPFAVEGQRILAVEAKSGAWGGRDVLLVVGRGAYLGAQGGVLAYRKVVRSPLEDRLTARLRELGFQPMRMPDTDRPSTEKVLGSLYQSLKLRPRDLDRVCYSTWLFSHLLQRNLHLSWTTLAAEHPASGAVRAAKAWDRRVYENLPLVASPVERLTRQDEAFNSFGRVLALRVAKETCQITGDRLSWAMLDQGREHSVQAAMLLQHAARLAILANIVEIITLLPGAEIEAALADHRRLPYHWRDRLSFVRGSAQAARWPLLWQTYLCCWGGFLVTSRRDDELEMIGEEVGLTADEASTGIAAFDRLFPLGGQSWHARTQTGLEVLSLVPAAVRGVGVLHRMRRSGIYRRDLQGRATVVTALEKDYGAARSAAEHQALWYDLGVAAALGVIPQTPAERAGPVDTGRPRGA